MGTLKMQTWETGVSAFRLKMISLCKTILIHGQQTTLIQMLLIQDYRLSNRGQNYLISDYWIRNSSYARLKTVEIGYNFDPSLTRKIFMQNVRAYLNFYNVWTIYSKMPKDFDPENQTYNTYPQQFITSVGLNITF